MFKNLESVPLSFFSQHHIQCVLIDIDNTIVPVDETDIDYVKAEWLKAAQKHVRVVLVSNNHGTRIQEISNTLELETFSFALKPVSRVYFHIKKKYNLNKRQIAVIGDQLLTDVLGGKMQGFKTIYVEPISQKDTFFTTISRTIERKLMKKWKK